MVVKKYSDISKGDKYWVKESGKGIHDWLGKVISKVPKSRTKLIMEDVTPDGKEEWKEKKGGGAYKTQYVNGFRGERSEVVRKQLYEK
tara:strand:+ start:720 stop:983 length:264 start_codon:yes stop_codon:yes gene_type:complete